MSFGLPRFHYRLIDRRTIAEIAHLLLRGSSTVLLGPRGAGKRYVFEVLMEFLKKGQVRCCLLEFDDKTPCRTETDLMNRLHQALPEATALPLSLAKWQASMMTGAEAHGILLLANVDAIAPDLSRKLLCTLREVVKASKLTVAVSGESNLIDLVSGPHSPFNCADQFVIQAHGRREFLRFLSKRMRVMGFRWGRPLPEVRRTLDELYALTGGDVVLLRTALICMCEQRNHHLKVSRECAPLPELLVDLSTQHLVPIGGLVPFRYAVRCVQTAPSYHRKTLQAMAEGRRLTVDNEAPSPLELAGLLRRPQNRADDETTITAEDPKWQWASIYTERFIKRYFDPTRLGDLHAAEGDWDDAFENYSLLPREARQRPLGDEDSISVRRVLAAASVEMNRLAKKEDWSKDLTQFMQRLAKYLFGFDQVAFFKPIAGEWQWRGGDATNIKPLHPVDELEPESQAHVTPNLAVVYHASEDVTGRSMYQACAIFEGGQDLSISPARRRIITEFLTSYQDAWEHGTLLSERERTINQRRQVLKLSSDLLRHSGNGGWGVDRMLKHTVESLSDLRLGVSRVIGLLPTKGGHLDFWTVVHDTACMDNNVEICLPPDDPCLSRKNKPKTWKTGRLPGWLKELGKDTNETLKERVMVLPVSRQWGDGQGADHLPAALLILELRAEVITPLFEDTLSIFSDRLASVLSISRNYSKLLHTINPSRNLTILLDRDEKIIFASRGAEKLGLSGISDKDGNGWIDEPLTIGDSSPDEKVKKHLRMILENPGKRCFTVTDLTAKMPGRWLADVFPLQEWNGEATGVAVVYRDRSFLFEYFDQLGRLSAHREVSTALNSFIDGLRAYPVFTDSSGNIGVTVRIYKMDPVNPERLISAYTSGLDPNVTERFEKGDMELTPDDDGGLGFEAVNKKMALVFRYLSNSDNLEDHTENGLRYRVIKDPPKFTDLVKRQSGDFWIDAPILVDGKVYGKMTLALSQEVGQKLQPEVVEMLQFIVFSLGGIIEQIQREETLKDTTSETLAETSHGLINSFSSLEWVTPQIRKLAGGEALADELDAWIAAEMAAIWRVKERYGQIVLRPVWSDLAEIIEHAMKRHAGERGIVWDWHCGLRPKVCNYWDETLATDVIRELAVNAWRWKHPNRDLRMSVRIKVTQGRAVVIISDNGRGVKPEWKSKIFDKMVSFREADLGKSSGWGLHHVRRITQARGGRVREKGKYGKGASFVFHLPLRPREPENVTPTISHEPKAEMRHFHS